MKLFTQIALFTLLLTSFSSLCFAVEGVGYCSGVLDTAPKASFATKQATNQRLAAAAGLVIHAKGDAIYKRTGDKTTGFTYVDAAGQPVTDEATLARIKSLKIPAGWHDVWVAVNPQAHLQAGGLDDKNRPQPRYHALWNSEVKDVAKFDRMFRFGQALPKLYAAIAHDITLPSSNPVSRLAAVTRLLETAGIRIGGELYAAENGHYGLTTLEVRHVPHVDTDSVDFVFIGKEGKAFEIHVPDPEIARVVSESKLGKAETDLLFDVSDNDVNQYIKKHTSREFSAKDVRTWLGTLTATRVLLERGPPQNELDAEAAEKAAAVAASERLGNEWTTALKNYIDHYIFDCYRDGKLAQASQQTGGTQVELALLYLLANKP